MFYSVLQVLVVMANLGEVTGIHFQTEKANVNETESHSRALTKRQEALLNIAASVPEFFITSDLNDGRRYWLTKEATFFSATFAQAFCVLIGGYLAEVDTQAEFSFLQSFISTHGSQFLNVATGGTDQGHEGRWINRHSTNPVAPWYWAPGQPDNDLGVENCQSFSRPKFWHLNDMQCVFASRSDIGFVCEVPEPK